MQIDQWLDAAKLKQGLKSDRALSTALGLAGASVSQFRTGRVLPSDSTMVRLATLAGRDPVIALLELDTWRADTPDVAALRAEIRGFAAELRPLEPETEGEQGATGRKGSVYYAERAIRAALALPAGHVVAALHP